jgi:hypothetical protein
MSVRDAIELAEMTEVHISVLGNNRYLRTLQPYTDMLSHWQNNRGVGMGDGGVDTINSTPPWIDAPPDFLPFDESATVALPAAPSVDTNVLTLVVPKGYDGVIQAYSINFLGGGFVPGSGTIVWRIAINGTPLRNFTNITTEKGSPEQPRALSGGIRLYSEQIVTLLVNHVSDNTLSGTVAGAFQGWFYPSKGK